MTWPSNPVIAAPDWGDLATIDETSAMVAGAPASNLFTLQPKEVARFSTLTPYVILDRGNISASWNLLAELFTNASSTAIRRIRASDSKAGLTSTPTVDTGQAMQFQLAGGYATQVDAGYTGITTDFTIEARIRWRVIDPAAFLLVRSSATKSLVLQATAAGGFSLSSAPSGIAIAPTGPAVEWPHLMEWFTVSIIVGPTYARLYLNGVQIGEDLSHSISFDCDSLFLSSPSFGGRIAMDWLRMWSVQRTNEQILANYATEIATAQTGLVANYRLNGTLANSGSVGGALSLVGTPAPTFVHSERVWASRGLEKHPLELGGRRRVNGFHWRPAAPVFNRWLRIDWDDTGNPDGYFEIGRLYIANGVQLGRNVNQGSELMGYDDTGSRQTARSGSTNVVPGVPVPRKTVSFRVQDEAELWTKLEPIVRTRGSTRDVLWVGSPADPDYLHPSMLYGTARWQPSRQTGGAGIFAVIDVPQLTLEGLL